jgi:hypothetical protein
VNLEASQALILSRSLRLARTKQTVVHTAVTPPKSLTLRLLVTHSELVGMLKVGSTDWCSRMGVKIRRLRGKYYLVIDYPGKAENSCQCSNSLSNSMVKATNACDNNADNGRRSSMAEMMITSGPTNRQDITDGSARSETAS